MGDLRGYQREMVDFLVTRADIGLPYAGIFWEMRVGKTPTILSLMVELEKKHGVKKVLVYLPLSALADWKVQVIDWTPDWGFFMMFADTHTPEEFNRAEKAIYFLPYSKRGKWRAKRLRGRKPEKGAIYSDMFSEFDMLIVDESHSIKNYATRQTKAVLDVSQRARFRYCLTGTPMVQSEVDYYTQCRVLSREIFGVATYGAFQATYFNRAHYGLRMRKEARESFYTALRRHTFSLRLQDVREELPSLTHVPVKFGETGEQKRVREELIQGYISTLEDVVITAPTAGAALMKFNQVSNWHCKGEDGKSVDLPENKKLEWLRGNLPALVEKDKVVIWCNFVRDWQLVCAELDSLGIRYIHYKSGATAKERERRLKQFRHPEGARVFVAHQASAGMGVNLAVASTTIVYSRNFNFGSYIQAMSRSMTIDKERLIFYHLITEDTADDLIYQSLGRKGNALKKDMATLLLKKILGR